MCTGFGVGLGTPFLQRIFPLTSQQSCPRTSQSRCALQDKEKTGKVTDAGGHTKSSLFFPEVCFVTVRNKLSFVIHFF